VSASPTADVPSHTSGAAMGQELTYCVFATRRQPFKKHQNMSCQDERMLGKS
jgi:hypothetical protein